MATLFTSSFAQPRRPGSYIPMGLQCLLLLVVSLLGVVAGAIDSTRQPTQLVHANWNRTDGLPAESTWAVHQSLDGYLWVGTEGGLLRFDGLHFSVFNSLTHEAFRADDIRSVVESPDGTLWAASYGGGVLRYRDNTFTRFDKSNGLINDVVYAVLVARNGDVWAGTATGACRLRDDQFTCWDKKDGLADGRVLRLAQDEQGRIWFATIGGGVSSFDGTKFDTYGLEAGLGSLQVFMLEEDPQLNVVIGTYAGDYLYVGADGLIKLDPPSMEQTIVPLSGLRDQDNNLWIGGNGVDGLWRILPDTQRLDGEEMDVSHVFDLTEDTAGGVWAATSDGLHHYRAGPFLPWGEPEGVGNGSFVVLPHDSADGVWVGTEGTGLYRVSGDGSAFQFTTEQGLPLNSVSALEYDANKVLWVGTFGGGLALFDEGHSVTVLNKKTGLASDQVSAIHRDHTGAMWVGTANGLSRLVDGEITHTLTTEDGLLANLVRHLSEDKSGHLLISSDSGLVRLSLESLTVVDVFDRERGLASDVVATTYVDHDGAIWIGHRSGGLARLDGNTLFRFERTHQLGIDSIMTIIEDYEGFFWLAGRRGIVRIARSDLENVVDGSASRVSSRAFTESDGLRSVRVPGGFKSASAKTGDGRVWFATASGLAVVDPRHVPSVAEPLNIIIERVQADGETLPGVDDFTIPSGTQTVQIDYTVPRLHDAESLQFRYRMQGENELWLDAGRRRTAFFTLLPARENVFEVGVTRIGQPFDQGERNVQRIRLFVEPLWYQTYGIQAIKAAAFVLCGWGLYRIAVRRYRRRQKRLEELVDDRTEALRAALGEVEKLSRTDALTQVANRRHFEERFAELWAAAVAQQQSISVMMIDIDYFKQFNDVAGHQAGDECLGRVAATLASRVRGNDFVARYGGEEFVVILVGSDQASASQVGERLQKSVRQLELPHPGRPAGSVVTVSAGFATAEPGQFDSTEALIKRADDALYQAKERGRDCIVVAEWARAS